jgi:hypothetical protein
MRALFAYGEAQGRAGDRWRRGLRPIGSIEPTTAASR